MKFRETLHRDPIALRVSCLVVVAGLLACGLEPDGSHKTDGRSDSAIEAAASQRAAVGRYQTEAIRVGVSQPILLLIDTATGLVLERPISGSQKFLPLTAEAGPRATLDPPMPGRFDVKVVPGGRRSSLLRLDTVTGESWFYQLGSKQTQWRVLPSALGDEPKKPTSLGRTETNVGDSTAPLNSSSSSQLGVGGVASIEKPTVESIVEVLAEPGLEPELRVWSAGQMAEIYPIEAAELVAAKLSSDDPKVLLAIIEKVQFDQGGRVRAALEKLQGHADTTVAAAVAQRLNR